MTKHMSSKNLLEGRTGPQTQTVAAVKTLLAWRGHPTEPMPSSVEMDGGRLVLVLNNKRDAYYVTTARACSCPAATYRPGQPCKHQRKYFPQPVPHVAQNADDAGPSLRPTGKWFGGHNGPVLEVA